MGMLWISAIDCVIRNKKIGEGFFKKLKVSQTLIHEVFKSPWYVLDEKHVREQSKRFLEWTDDDFMIHVIKELIKGDCLKM